ncbi:hypothetical protein BDV25DRAFT_139923 [Aspergillus avenaceus]|uniref:BZIP domain-containing protein n=1 Tax=Aspergillus avenaceus TaxID=36643 RepID=A0A5N6TVN6_ASPAV|nr:hypothetical protein BDV25DRAFT_139923 [Aspergillus avenaceus]
MDGGMQLQSYDGIVSDISDSDSPLLPWDEIYQKVLLTPRLRPSLVDSSFATSQLSSLLSASSYPIPETIPEAFYPQRPTEPWSYTPQLQTSSNHLLPSPPSDRDHVMDFQRQIPSRASQTQTPTTQRPPKRQHDSTPAPATTKKRGRPRKTMDTQLGEDPEERRRMQIRLAQRAYRSRKEANITSLKGRISQLESTLEKMSSAVVSFSDDLVLSGALTSHPDIASRLRDTVQTCLTLAKEANKDSDHDLPDISSHSEESISSPPPGPENKSEGRSISAPTTTLGHQFDSGEPVESVQSISPPLSAPLEVSVMEIPTFIERLHMACVYQGYLVLTSPSVPMSRIERPFRFLLTLMDRVRLTAAFEALLHAKLTQKRLEACYAGVPFFKLGGAGTHYPRSTDMIQEDENPLQRYQQWTTIHDPLSRFSPDIRREMGGDWFDMQDLAGYLKEKNVVLLSSPPKPDQSSRLTVNATRLIQALIGRGICLGRSPGFSRYDVDKALRSSSWT